MRGVTAEQTAMSYSNLFQLTRLMRGVTVRKAYITNVNKFQLTRLMRGVTIYFSSKKPPDYNFNSHASCEA